MVKKEDFQQAGICPNCSAQTRQELLFATNDYLDIEGSGRGGYMSRSLSFFRCTGCGSISTYATDFEYVQMLPKAERVARLLRYEFSNQCKLVYSTPPANYWKVWFQLLDVPPDPNCVDTRLIDRDSRVLDPASPQAVTQCYEIGVAVRPISLDLYALQLRKALEAVCRDLGASELLDNGRRTMLWQQIDELGKQNVVGEFICEAAHELKQISNTGAHYSEREVSDGDIRKLEHLLALITTYVYGDKKLSS